MFIVIEHSLCIELYDHYRVQVAGELRWLEMEIFSKFKSANHK